METIILNHVPQKKDKSIATIGMFDGVHRGHQLLIRMVTDEARRLGFLSTVVTFDKSPRQVLDPSFKPQMLTTLEEKTEAIGALGVDRLAILPFNHETAALSAKDFMKKILKEQLCVNTLITGYDNRFGHRSPATQKGNHSEGFEDYVNYGRELGIEVLRGDVKLTADGSRPLSSSVIRKLLAEEGRVDLMPECMGNLYQLKGTVEAGEHIGHRLGFPTANLHPESPYKLIPASGVYAVWATIGGKRLPAMMNIGNRPTFEGKNRTLEVHILDFDGNLYGSDINVSFVKRLREERRFETSEALIEQLKKDRLQVKSALEES